LVSKIDLSNEPSGDKPSRTLDEAWELAAGKKKITRKSNAFHSMLTSVNFAPAALQTVERID
jgi:hypothetical protein